MNVVLVSVVADDAHEISFGHGAVHVADDNLILQVVQVHFSLQHLMLCFELDSVLAVLEVQFVQYVSGGVEWLEVSILVKRKLHVFHYVVIDEHLDALLLSLDGERAEAGQEWRGLEGQLIPLHYYDVADAGDERSFFVG